jgi:hypothetical protein
VVVDCNAPDNNLEVNFACELSLLNISKFNFDNLTSDPACAVLLLLLQGKYKFNVEELLHMVIAKLNKIINE